jgi:glycosyltransferase involved in cell wall biosynthesis
MPLRLCFFARTLPAHRGGKGMFHPHIAAMALAGRGHRITILSTAHPAMARESPAPNVEIHYLPGTPPDRYSEEFFGASARAFEALHAEEPFDAAWSDSAGAAGWSREHRGPTPLVAVCHAGLTMMNAGASRDFFATTHHEMLRRAAAIVAVSETVAESIRDGLPGCAGKIRVVLNGADPAIFRVAPDEVLRRTVNPDGRPLLMYLGRVVKEKGGEDLLRAVAMLPEPRPRVAFVGPGLYGDELRAIAAELGVGATVVPGVAHGDVPRYLALADVFVLPSYHAEGLPFSLIEAMLCRRAIVATDIGGVREVITNGRTGLLVPPRDAEQLARAIARFLGDAAIRRRYGDAAHADAMARFSLDAMTSNLERLLIGVCRRAAQPV